MTGGSCERILAVIWNFIALYLVLSLCLLSWYSRLYTSWACITDTDDILLFCQFTNQVIIVPLHPLSPSLPLPHPPSLSLSVAVLFSFRFSVIVVKKLLSALTWSSVCRVTLLPTTAWLLSTLSTQRSDRLDESPYLVILLLSYKHAVSTVCI